MLPELDNNRSLIAYLRKPESDAKRIAEALAKDEQEIMMVYAKPERVLYQCCLVNLLMARNYEATADKSKGLQIADDTDKLFYGIRDAFNGKILAKNKKLESKFKEIDEFVDNIASSVDTNTPLNEYVYDCKWQTEKVEDKKSWIKRAIQTYKTIKLRVEEGDYTLPSGYTIADLTKEYCKRSLEFKIYRGEARTLAEDFLREHADQLGGTALKYMPPSKHECMVVTGSIAAGKSTLTKSYLDNLSHEKLSSFLVADTDEMKIALMRSASRDNIQLTNPDQVYSEAKLLNDRILDKAQALIENNKRVPHVLVNYTTFTPDRVVRALAGNGSVELHHISTTAEVAEQAAEHRPGGRNFNLEQMKHFCARADKNPQGLPVLAGSKVSAYIYDRPTPNCSPKLAAAFDFEDNKLFIMDPEAFTRVIARSDSTRRPDAVVDNYLQKVKKNRITIIGLDPKHVDEGKVVARVNPDESILLLDNDNESSHHYNTLLRACGTFTALSRFTHENPIDWAGRLDARKPTSVGRA